jgi:cell wall-associated NlpC family hydrolase
VTASQGPRKRLRMPGRARRALHRSVTVRALVLALAFALLAAPAASMAAPRSSGDLGRLRADAAALRVRLDREHLRLEQLAEELKEAYAGGVELLAEASALERRQRDAEREMAEVKGQLDARIRASYIGGPASSYLSALVTAEDPAELLRRLPLQQAVLQADVGMVERVRTAQAKVDRLRQELSARLVTQARMAQDLAAKQAEARALADRLDREVRTMDRRMARMIEDARRAEETDRRLAFNRWMAGSIPAGLPGKAATAAAGKAVRIALGQRGAPYRWGATGPTEFDCSGLTSFAYAAAGAPIPRVSRSQYSVLAAAGKRVDMAELLPGDLVFFATNPGDPRTIHHVGMYIGKGLMVHAPRTGDVVRTASVWRDDYAGAVRPAAAAR